ncbi:MAG TPA: response regulator, partial [Candidatus Eisenbacteria bacterium]|nr:response regulator [Candidatus Eisenbacteria bacterium]
FANASEAIAALDHHTPHLLISDISMPEEDGYAMIRRMRALSRESGGALPAIALTALADPYDRMQALEAGYQIHLAKPVDFDHLLMAAVALASRRTDPTTTTSTESVA